MNTSTLTRYNLLSSGWRLSTEHSSSSYGIPVLVAPYGEAVGDLDLVCLAADGSLCEDMFEGRLFSGLALRTILASNEVDEEVDENV